MSQDRAIALQPGQQERNSVSKKKKKQQQEIVKKGIPGSWGTSVRVLRLEGSPVGWCVVSEGQGEVVGHVIRQVNGSQL